MSLMLVTVALLSAASAAPVASGLDAELVVQTGHTFPIKAATFLPDGKRLLTGGYDRTARLWDFATGREIRTLAQAKGFRTLADDAIARVLLGQTSLEEISRVVDLTDRVI